MRLTICCLALCLMPYAPAIAVDFQCGNYIVEEGMSLDEVREYCGEPTQDDGDRWIYDRGPPQLVIVIYLNVDNTVGEIQEKPRE